MARPASSRVGVGSGKAAMASIQRRALGAIPGTDRRGGVLVAAYVDHEGTAGPERLLVGGGKFAGLFHHDAVGAERAGKLHPVVGAQFRQRGGGFTQMPGAQIDVAKRAVV